MCRVQGAGCRVEGGGWRVEGACLEVGVVGPAAGPQRRGREAVAPHAQAVAHAVAAGDGQPRVRRWRRGAHAALDDARRGEGGQRVRVARGLAVLRQPASAGVSQSQPASAGVSQPQTDGGRQPASASVSRRKAASERARQMQPCSAGVSQSKPTAGVSRRRRPAADSQPTANGRACGRLPTWARMAEWVHASQPYAGKVRGVRVREQSCGWLRSSPCPRQHTPWRRGRPRPRSWRAARRRPCSPSRRPGPPSRAAPAPRTPTRWSPRAARRRWR